MWYRVAIAMVATALASTQASAATTPLSREMSAIQKAEDDWRKARIAGDVGFLEKFYASEMRVQGMGGGVQSRSEDIAMFASGRLKPKFIDHGPLDISIYGKTALVTGLDHLGGTMNGHYGEMYLRFTDMLVKRDGRWQLVIQQATPAKAP